jgi:hypothetical protein
MKFGVIQRNETTEKDFVLRCKGCLSHAADKNWRLLSV